MIISPPFLPPPGNDENAWLDQAMMSPPSRMSSTQAPEGSFPLSNQLCWHNGLHVKGALEANGGCTIRAIADGVVIAVTLSPYLVAALTALIGITAATA